MCVPHSAMTIAVTITPLLQAFEIIALGIYITLFIRHISSEVCFTWGCGSPCDTRVIFRPAPGRADSADYQHYGQQLAARRPRSQVSRGQFHLDCDSIWLGGDDGLKSGHLIAI